jgi:hypothetical protein
VHGGLRVNVMDPKALMMLAVGALLLLNGVLDFAKRR